MFHWMFVIVICSMLSSSGYAFFAELLETFEQGIDICLKRTKDMSEVLLAQYEHKLKESKTANSMKEVAKWLDHELDRFQKKIMGYKDKIDSSKILSPQFKKKLLSQLEILEADLSKTIKSVQEKHLESDL